MAEENQDTTSVLDSLVGEGKKFASVEVLAKAKLDSDNFIKILEQQIADLKTETLDLQKKADRTEALENLMTKLADENNNSNPGNRPESQPSDKGNHPQTLTHEDVVKLLEEREAARQLERNLSSAKDQLKKAYGDRLDETLKTKAEALGLTVEQLEALGRTSPQALLNLVGGSQPSTRSATFGSSTNSEALANHGSGGEVRNKEFYDSLRKSMGARAFAFDRKLQIQMHQDMTRLGDAWDAQT